MNLPERDRAGRASLVDRQIGLVSLSYEVPHFFIITCRHLSSCSNTTSDCRSKVFFYTVSSFAETYILLHHRSRALNRIENCIE